MFDAFYIYSYYQNRDNNPVYIQCIAILDWIDGNDIHGNQNFVPVEFAGVVTAVLFYVSIRLP